jgi:hypothetical protein
MKEKWEVHKMSMIKLGKFEGNDIELCRTTNSRVGTRTTELLLKEQIPFRKDCRRIPFYKRDRYDGANMIWVISINPHRYGQARRALDTMDLTSRRKLVLSNY